MSLEFKPLLNNNAEMTSVLSSKAGLVIKTLNQKMMKEGIAGPITEEAARALLPRHFPPGVTADDVIEELRKTGIIPPLALVKKVVLPPEKVSLQTKLAGIKKVDEMSLKKQLAENKFFFDELERNVFKRPRDLDMVYNQALLFGSENSIEKDEYYYEFADAGLIKGGRTEVQKDLLALAERQQQFKDKNAVMDAKQVESVEKNKKIATFVERSVAYGVSELGWYGQNVKIDSASQFDDVKRRIDQVLEITKKETESSFLGLGIDVTYSGLLSERYKDKFTKLLESIQHGQKTKVKYFKNYKGEKMGEFAVPKAILHFDVDDVKEMVHSVKNINDPKIRDKFKNSHLKFDVLNQIMIQCELLAKYAEECQNDISEKYVEIANSINELGRKNPEIQQVLDARHEDQTTSRLKYLINEFRDTEIQKRGQNKS